MMTGSERRDLRVLWVDDDRDLTSNVSRYLGGMGYTVECAHDLSGAGACIAERCFDVAIIDLNLPDGNGFTLLQDAPRERVRQFIVLTGNGSVKSAVDALRYQVFDFLIKPIELTELCNVLARASGGAAQVPGGTTPAAASQVAEEMLVGVSPAMRQVQSLLNLASTSDITVFLQGESGTGKEVAAQALHRLSYRRHEPFVAFNCGAVAPALAPSELFGHERGSFTGAQSTHRGIFERAEGGTLFLDEITEMPPDLQASLLRVLETGTIVRVGGDREIPVNVRIIAATNRDPKQSVEEGRFRLDLYYRLQVFPMVMPPLRERRGDIPALVQFFLSRHGSVGQDKRRLSAAAMNWLVQHDWPGNVRELRNVIDRACLLSGGAIEPEHLLLLPPPVEARSAGDTLPASGLLRDAELQLILRVLEDCNGNKTRAAARLGVSVRTLYNKLRRQRSAAAMEG